MRLSNVIIFMLLSIFPVRLYADMPTCHITHYSTEDGLPQHNVMDILQDKKGFLWFATWNGVCKFNGYEFTTYALQPDDSDYRIRSNRFDHIYEDHYGFIWMQSYDGEPHRFDPVTETFRGIRSVAGLSDHPFRSNSIIQTPSGKVWLLSQDDGCICVRDSSFSIDVFNRQNGRLKNQVVLSVHEDSRQNTWLLTDNGLIHLRDGDTLYISPGGRSGTAFYSVMELDDELWFGSAGQIWCYSKNDRQFRLMDLQASSDVIQMKRLDKDRVVVLTSGSGFFIHHLTTGRTDVFNKGNLPGMTTDRMVSCYVDRSLNLWLEMDIYGVAKFTPSTRFLKHFTPEIEGANVRTNPPLFIIFEDKGDRLWVQPRGGGFSLYDPDSDLLEPFFNQPGSPGWRFSNVLHSGFCDHQGNLWLCTHSLGLEKIVFDENLFRNIYIDADHNSTASNYVRAIFEDDRKQRWIATRDGKLRIYDENGVFKGFFCEDGRIGPGRLLSGFVYCITQDKEKNIWIGTKGDGIFCAERVAGSPLRYHVTNFRNIPDDPRSLSSDNVYDIHQDHTGRIWIGTYGGGINYLEKDDDGRTRFIHHQNGLKTYPFDEGAQVRCISEDKAGKICVGTTIGLIMFSAGFSDPGDIGYRYYVSNPADKESLGNNNVHQVCHTTAGEMFLATFGGGLNKVVERDSDGFPVRFRSYTRQHGLTSDVTLSIVEDRNGRLWVSTENNIVRFDPVSEAFESYGEVKRLMLTNTFSEAASLQLSTGEMLFGHHQGILSFFPVQIRNNTFKPYIALNEFRLFNKPVKIGSGSPLETNIDNTKRLTLTHRQNFFSIEYAALDFCSPENISYAYMLKGLDNEWQYVQHQRIANYTSLPKGKYIFCVRSTNSDGVWADNDRQLFIEILPSFWETSWAYALYVLAFILLVATCTGILYFIYRLKHQVAMESQLSEMKIRFFTDISHEIRTPLTMITGPVDYLLHDSETPEKVKKQIGYIAQSTDRMLRMVNQILDFRKIQHHRLKVEETSVSLYVGDICEGFRETARERHIDFLFTDLAQGVKIWVDRDSLDKIIYNLLSNAFKYTPQGRKIEVLVEDAAQSVSITVKDEGEGIARDRQRSLFTRFVSFNEDKSKPSTGIGLYMVKELADKHQAKVSVASEPGQGSSFIITFPKGTGHFGKGVDLVLSGHAKPLPAGTDIAATPDEPARDIKVSILIVEDDDSLRLFLKTILEKDYNLFEAKDGKDGLEKALQYIPDLIVSDIMMPVMDGIQMLKQLKANMSTSHIPVVLLTAKTAIESKIDGLDYGADDYITKPFSVQYFHARIKNLLHQREHLQKLYCSNLLSNTFAPQEPQITSQDQIFMDKVLHSIEDNMDNPEYEVESLVGSVGMSRTVFFKKLKSLTGLAPVEFIRDIKIQRAAQLIVSDQLTIKEITFRIGMTDTKYFGKCFKKKYGVTPSQYKTEHKKE